MPDRESLPHEETPIQNPTFDRRLLSGNPEEQLLFSHITGTLTVRELGVLTGLEGLVGEVLARLEVRNAVVILGRPSGTLPVAKSITVASPEEKLPHDTDLEPEKEQQIDTLFHSLTTTTHYKLLGVSRDVNKAQLKTAYYEQATAYHPDRYFRKRLGGYRSKLETIFQRLTLAYDTLVNNEARANYDAAVPGESLAPSSSVSTPLKAPPSSQVSLQEREQTRRRLLAAKLRGRGSFSPPDIEPNSRKR